ncbi:hypothetical protein R1sor_004683 [Riccia sorocarpa]|uniref:Plant bHLH transcription factor ACT-like domain-containing protein n=1 Tax=Riccia sorocarpa TaxID=122646 RepID=A0ABD3HKW4_9MARC
MKLTDEIIRFAGFISIDCGSTVSYTESLGIELIGDGDYASDVYLELSCPWRKTVLADVLRTLIDLQLDVFVVQAATNNGTFNTVCKGNVVPDGSKRKSPDVTILVYETNNSSDVAKHRDTYLHKKTKRFQMGIPYGSDVFFSAS